MAFGDGTAGQLGLGTAVKHALAPTTMPNLDVQPVDRNQEEDDDEDSDEE